MWHKPILEVVEYNYTFIVKKKKKKKKRARLHLDPSLFLVALL